LIEQIEEFYIHFKPKTNKDILHGVLMKHLEYKTLIVANDEKGITGLMRFNVNGECAHILDLIVREDIDSPSFIRLLASRAWHRFPYVRYYRFERELKYPGQKPKAHRITALLKGK
jgi:hypothetical protein